MDFEKDYDQIEALVEQYFPDASEEEVEDIIDGLEMQTPDISFEELESTIRQLAPKLNRGAPTEDKNARMSALDSMRGY